MGEKQPRKGKAQGFIRHSGPMMREIWAGYLRAALVGLGARQLVE